MKCFVASGSCLLVDLSEVKQDCLQLFSADWKSAQCENKESTSQIAKGTTQRLNTWNTHNLIKILRMRKIHENMMVKIQTVLDPICLTMHGSFTECPTCGWTVSVIVKVMTGDYHYQNFSDWHDDAIYDYHYVMIIILSGIIVMIITMVATFGIVEVLMFNSF